MNREYEFSVVVFAKDTAKLYRTFKNVREVTPEGTVQILAVCIAGDMDIPDERDMRELEEAGEKEKELKDEELDRSTESSIRRILVSGRCWMTGIFYILTDWNAGILWRS